ncbi:YppG family protein [Virgibacillus xinjiangensis]|uniref:YppG family protein n=1 Tax=Virgibacillus xinjiangensis TaxID=393090 RepID=A0ABV7CSS0_9BACI
MSYFGFNGYPPRPDHIQPNPSYIQYSSQYPPQNIPMQVPPQTPYQAFAKPKHPEQWPHAGQLGYSSFTGGKPGSNLFAYFQGNKGQVDIEKMIGTVSQLANTYHQVSPIVKEFGSILKNIR